MASFVLLLGLCSLAVANPLTSTTDAVKPRGTDDFSANVTTDNIVNDIGTAHIPLSTNYVGCYSEATGSRALSRATLTHPRLTIGVCQDFCKGYRFCMVDTPQMLFSLWPLLTCLPCRRPRVRKRVLLWI